ncbi:hypothetical protein PCC7424_0465 [Gloeothece citriformis PCC 7424]|uniref:Inhibitor of g-type lysozyme n=1 Tax=Gloeothece citriformis (strain PCC 7424) TaxID=65393 RepID=B7KDB1_GLOC7|nr:hypothetical protein [Gloeothece citriformis]ACK68931.1 hypothetical protein PCC7424_0465 [Gloeothece citriformis PCC 7424]
MIQIIFLFSPPSPTLNIPPLVWSIAQASTEVRVQFAPGESSAQLSGKVQGYQTVNYLLRANANQELSVKFSSNSRFTMLGIYTPTGEELCVETCGDRWSGLLPTDGDYRVRVGLVRAEARRNGQANYTLDVSIK